VGPGWAFGSWDTSTNVPASTTARIGCPKSATGPGVKRRRSTDPTMKAPAMVSAIRSRRAISPNWRRIPPGRAESKMPTRAGRRTRPKRNPFTCFSGSLPGFARSVRLSRALVAADQEPHYTPFHRTWCGPSSGRKPGYLVTLLASFGCHPQAADISASHGSNLAHPSNQDWSRGQRPTDRQPARLRLID